MAKLTEERWRQLEALYWDAVKLDEGDQADLVLRVTDPELQRELRGMLAQSGSAGKNIIQAIAGVAISAVPHENSGSENWTGRRFGPYQVLRVIGRGGMGLVFEAQRDDEEFRKRVALKIAPEWRHDPLLHERIRHERQILAGLEHPNIARLLDGGTEDGVPYFAMEYVEGCPITEYARTSGLSLRQRIVLFRQVLDAVHCAHENLVVHRDLKPGNILVSAGGVPKLLDFGIAKLLSLESPRDTTATGMMWTPEYTSPEQLRAKAITTRTDVYSLGLILYELLCEERGQAADASSPIALDRSICEVEPPPPSARAYAKGNHVLARQLEGDLDTIVAMAIRKEPERRYGSAAELSADLGRYLDGLAVRARAGSIYYRTGKYVRRHRGAVLAVGLLVASVAAGLVATVHEARRADRRFQQVRKLANAFVFDVHDRLLPLPNSTSARKAIVATALTYLENLSEEAGGDRSLLRELATAYIKIGDAQGHPGESNLGDRAGALKSYSRAEGIFESLVAKGDDAARPGLAASKLKLGLVRRERGDMHAALKYFDTSRSLIEPQVKAHPDDRDILSTAGELYSAMTRLLLSMNDKRATETAHASMEIASRFAALDPGNKEHGFALAAAYSSLGAAHVASGQIEDAARDFRKTMELRAELVREEPDNRMYRRNLMIGYGNLGDVLGFRTGENLGDTEGAAAAFEKALENAVWLNRNDPADQKAVFDVASARLRVGSVLLDSGQPAKALDHLRTAKENLNRLVKEDPANPRFRQNAAFVNWKMGQALEMLGQRQEAKRLLEEAASAATTLTKGTDAAASRQLSILSRLQLARLHSDDKDPRANSLAGAIAEDISHSPSATLSRWTTAVVYGDLGRVYRRMAQKQDAITWLEKGRAQWQSLHVPSALEKRRTTEIAAIDQELAMARKP